MMEGCRNTQDYAGLLKVTDMGNSLRERPKQSPVDESLDMLLKVTNGVRIELSELQARLSPVSAPTPTEGKSLAGCARPGSSCVIEERINDAVSHLLGISSDLRNLRDSLCI